MDGHTQATGATAYPALVPSLTDLLHAAVGGVGGTERPGQVEMAQAVADAIDTKSHLLVQAGTGTGKSLAYLVPAVQHAGASAPPQRIRDRHAGLPCANAAPRAAMSL